MEKLIAILFLVVLAAVVGKNLLSGNPVLPLRVLSGEIQNPHPAASPLHAQQQVFVDRFNADPELRARFAGTFSSKGLYAELSGAKQLTFGQRIAAVFANPVGSSDRDACWAINTIALTSAQRSPDHAGQTARLIRGGQ